MEWRRASHSSLDCPERGWDDDCNVIISLVNMLVNLPPTFSAGTIAGAGTLLLWSRKEHAFRFGSVHRSAVAAAIDS